MKTIVYHIFCAALAACVISLVVMLFAPFVGVSTLFAVVQFTAVLMVTFPVFLLVSDCEKFDIYEMMEEDILF